MKASKARKISRQDNPKVFAEISKAAYNNLSKLYWHCELQEALMLESKGYVVQKEDIGENLYTISW